MSVTATSNPAGMSLVLPLYNEADGIREIVEGLVAALVAASVPHQLVLVNNGSTDGSASILEALASRHPSIHIVTVPVNQGYGWGILCGLREATAPIVGFMCADGQIAPADVVRVYERMARGDCDVAKVVRVTREDGTQRRVMSAVYNLLFRLLFSMRARDINGTPKLMSREWCDRLALTSRDWFIDAELMIGLARGGARVAEVPVAFTARVHGNSNVRLTTSLEFLRNMLVHWVRRP
ncbi:MAG: glycosyltransferase family 2 protein [Vicinamibacterales bacterium]